MFLVQAGGHPISTFGPLSLNHSIRLTLLVVEKYDGTDLFELDIVPVRNLDSGSRGGMRGVVSCLESGLSLLRLYSPFKPPKKLCEF